MSYSPPPSGASLATAARRLGRWERAAVTLAGGLLIGLLITAALLKPSPAGLGTLQQLGLPPCTFRQLFGIRCPSCGMTTSWSHLMHGSLTAAWRANVGGTLLALVAAWCGPWLFLSGVRSRWLLAPPHELVLLVVGLTVVVVTLIDWTVRLSLGW
jgi:hypothetical protein